MFQLVSGAVRVGIATTVFTAVSGGHTDPQAGFVAGLHPGLRIDAAIAAFGLLTVWGIVRPARPSEASGPPEPALAQ